MRCCSSNGRSTRRTVTGHSTRTAIASSSNSIRSRARVLHKYTPLVRQNSSGRGRQRGRKHSRNVVRLCLLQHRPRAVRAKATEVTFTRAYCRQRSVPRSRWMKGLVMRSSAQHSAVCVQTHGASPPMLCHRSSPPCEHRGSCKPCIPAVSAPVAPLLPPTAHVTPLLVGEWYLLQWSAHAACDDATPSRGLMQGCSLLGHDAGPSNTACVIGIAETSRRCSCMQ